MKTFILLIISFFFFTQTASSADNICQPSSCDYFKGPQVRFPFHLTDRWCGYEGFDLSCDTHNQTLLKLPSTGDLVVTQINYVSQELFFRPQFCLPGQILSFSLSGSPFTGPYMRNFTFYNCSAKMKLEYPKIPLDCLSGDNYTVFALATIDFGMGVPAICRSISTVGFPVREWFFPSKTFVDDFQLSWDAPHCKACEIKGGTCGVKSGTEMKIHCFIPGSEFKSVLSSTAKLGICLGIGIPFLVFAIGVVYYEYKKEVANRRRPNLELPTLTSNPQRAVLFTGLDGATIESYPKTVLGESRRLLKTGDITCTICLSEYLPKDTLRTIPECGHYFHIDCIDEWLKLNATCPVCRHLP